MTAPGVDAIVLAGGASSRFGSDKLAASLDGRPLLHHALEAVGVVADRIIVVIGPEAPSPSVPQELAARVVFARDAAAHDGPLAGLAAGLAAAVTPVGDEPPRIALVVGGDMPTLVPAVLRLLVERLAAEPALAVMTLAASRPAPLPAAVRPDAVRAAVDAILASGGRRSLLAPLGIVPSAILAAEEWRALDPEGDTLRDIDTPADLPRP
ncbi:MAG: NTP transferase domain-containing protein [Chloroflexi bacterium]|nr:NTP transferase domain-containing protein [Chloroflexota bacterium]